MGMSASQARYLGLTARKSNIEYQGQLINQERTILSQQCTALYNTLLDLQVPTPPSTSDFTKVVYTGADGATNFELGNIVPHQGGTYSIDFKYQTTGHYLNEGGQAAVRNVPCYKLNTSPAGLITQESFVYHDMSDAERVDTGSGTYTSADTILHDIGTADSYTVPGGYTGKFYVLDNNKFIEVENQSDLANYGNKKVYIKMPGDDPTLNDNDYKLNDTTLKTGGGYSKTVAMQTFYAVVGGKYRTLGNSDFGDSSSNKPFIKLGDGTYKFNGNQNTVLVARKDEAEEVSPDDPDAISPDIDGGVIGLVAEKECYRLKDAVNKGLISDTSLSEYIQAIRNAFPVYADTEEYSDLDIQDMFAVYCTNDSSSGRLVPHFVLTEEVMNHIGDQNDMHYVTTYDYNSSGRYTEIETKKDCMLVFDAQGRITQVKVPNYDENGNITTYKTIDLSAEQQTDNDAYNDAFNKYEYQQYLYDKKQQEINRKTEIIQQEDRSLELKLTRLDNERKAVDTELEAVKKVIQDNIDKSFKTFSG